MQAGALIGGLLAQWLLHTCMPDAFFPPFAIGDRVVRLTPGWFATLAIERLGAGAHVLLAIAVILAIAVLAACGTWRWWGALVSVCTTVVAALIAPIGTRPAYVIAALLAGLAGALPILWPWRLRTHADHDARRRFLTTTGTLGASIAAALVVRLLGRRPPASTPGAAFPEDPAIANVPGLSPLITPTERHYVVSINYEAPRLDPANWRLRLSGRVAASRELTLAQLRMLGEVRQAVLMQCISNPIGGDLIGNAAWTGVPLDRVLRTAGVLEGAVALRVIAADGYHDVLPLATGAEALIGWAMNDAALPADHGSPVRLLLPRHYGMRSVKWLREIEAVTSLPEGYWASRGWDSEAVMRPGARIDTPAADATVGGRIVVAGVAWAPAGVRTVEVRLDDGEWQPASLEAAAGPLAWQRWAATVTSSSGRRLVTARVTDGHGRTQSEEPLPALPSGAQGLHRVIVNVA
jgi:DMSO/TMAO reductase YedYZ molybdopterin-dependent catalytic subunit